MLNGEILNPNAIRQRGITNSDRFWNFVCKADNFTDCWEWMGSHSSRYGKFKLSCGGISVNLQAHRYSYYLEYGYFPTDDEVVCHRCDNPYCVNPHHLFLGSQLDNVQDMIKKGRNVDNTGDLNPNCKLSSEKVTQMRKLHQEDGVSGNKLSVMFNISRTQTSRILSGESWSADGSH